MPHRRSLGKKYFIFAVIGITILGYLTSGLLIIYPDNAMFEFCFIGFAGVGLVNTNVPYLLLTL